ncbi:phosphoglycerate dehydrogenase [Methyloceanibacter caenitepidi]|uniref:D-3-phosphoglycerate dehydrogenase n=1 Tax=Methyloceanibacter caenitepidi TaxID=1384459 RepID=A0A0A8K145_9HYPH|nr:phosphoglycerate dehydrogenase [Methyloceanibacter caenitepidi]BAQ15714.1 D-3-phosphoglycerate dehydrogenase [Methyloceanibacter caenitepidi]
MYRALVTCHHLQRYFEDFRPFYEAAGVEPILPTIEGQQLDAAAMREAIVGVDAVIAGDDEIDASVLEAGKSSQLKAVIKWGIGTDSIDKAKAAELGIPVYNTPGTFANEVADLALSLLLNVLRQTHHMHNSVREGGWRKVPGRSLAGMTAGVIGLGSIGQAIAKRTVAFGMETIGYDVREIDQETLSALGVMQVDLPALFAQSDAILVACELTPESRHLLRDETFAQMKEGVYIVNVSRGPLIHEAALCRALESGKVAGAGLDVFEVEPLPQTSALHGFDTAVFSTHNGSNTIEAVARVNAMTTDILLHVLGLKDLDFTPNRVA